MKYAVNSPSLTAPCGLDCFNYDIYKENLTNEYAELIHNKLGVARDEIACKGCHQQDGKHFHLSPEGRETLNCVKAKGVNICCGCDEFPCAFLAPIAVKAAIYPHNMKLYNLCRIKKVGLECWIDEETGHIRKKYFMGKFIAGRDQID